MSSPEEDQQSSWIGPVPTGFSEIDTALDGGLQPGSLTVIAGYTGTGVTALATHVATQLITLRNGAANIVSLDTPSELP
ncbi:DnaB-like helicase C-terminal domain-containing protein [Mycolicibacter minnesotensis]